MGRWPYPLAIEGPSLSSRDRGLQNDG